MHVDAVGNDFAGHLRVNQHCARVPVVHLAHGVEQVGGVEDSRLHPLHHVLVGGVGMACLEDDSLFQAEEGQLPHTLDFRSHRHVDNLSLGGCPQSFHQL